MSLAKPLRIRPNPMRPAPTWPVLLATLPGLLFASGCHPTFDVTVTGQSTISGNPLPAAGLISLPLSFAGFDGLDLSSTQEFKNQGVSKNEVQRVTLKSVTLSISAPSGATFDFLNSIAFDASAPGQSQVPVAQLTSVPPSVSELSLQVDGVDLAPYVTAPSMSVTTDAQGMPPSQDTTVNAVLVFEVVANIP
jgi:hypothetical protein